MKRRSSARRERRGVVATNAQSLDEREREMVEIREEETSLLNGKEENTSQNSTKANSIVTAFAFWAYLSLLVSIFALAIPFFSSFKQPPFDDKSWLLSLTPSLSSHFANGKTIELYIGRGNQQPSELFAFEVGPPEGETVLLVHGAGCNSFSFRSVQRLLAGRGFRSLAVDLPGSGLSAKSVEETVEDEWPRIFDPFRDVYDEIKEKGLFWGFDQLVETGGLPYEEKKPKLRFIKKTRPIRLDSTEIVRVVEQLITSMRLSPVHLVLHDSAAMAIREIMGSADTNSIKSVTILDGATNAKSTAFPLWVLNVVGVREVLLSSEWIYTAFLRQFCSKGMSRLVGNDHRVLLKSRGGLDAFSEMMRQMNSNFDLMEWAKSDTMNGMPVAVVWSNNWSEDWSEEGRRVAAAFPRAEFFPHSGGRWPQEDAADSVAEAIAEFISSLPKSVEGTETPPSILHRHGYHEIHDHENPNDRALFTEF